MRKLAFNWDKYAKKTDAKNIKDYTEMNCDAFVEDSFEFQITRAYIDKFVNPFTKVKVSNIVKDEKGRSAISLCYLAL